MKSLGTITMYYPFIDPEIRSVIESIMDDSQTYREFTLKLGERVCSKEVPVHLAYLAAVHSWQMAELVMIQQIAANYHQYAIIRPWTNHQRIMEESGTMLTQIRESIEDTINSKPEDWILAQLPQIGEGLLGFATEFTGFIEDVGKLLDNQPDLECFKSGFHNLRCWIHTTDDDTKMAISEIELGLEIARKYDDRYRVMKLLIDFANLIKNSDVRSALNYLEKAHVICKELDARSEESVILNEMGLVSTILGEYDLAIRCHLDSVHSEKREGGTGYYAALNLSHAYRNLDDHVEALAWAESAMESADPSSTIWSHLTIARSLIGLGALEKAAHHLDVSKIMSLKSGQESVLGQYYYVLGLYELRAGDPKTAIQTLQQSLDIYQRLNILLYVIYCLLALTEAELTIVKSSDSVMSVFSSDSWMSKLWKLAVDYDLPGIMIRHELMRSELLLKQDQTNSAREILENALSISNSPGVRTLREKILIKIQMLETDL